MRRHRSLVAAMIAALLLLASSAGSADSRADKQSAPAVLERATVQEVLLDVIARNKRGAFVDDLRLEEVEIHEDGVRQEVTSFRLISGQEAISRAAQTDATIRLEPLRQVRLVSLVFERLGQDGRRRSRTGALDFVRRNSGENVYYAVLRIDHSLKVVRWFTNDREAVHEAIVRATGEATQPYASGDPMLTPPRETPRAPKTEDPLRRELSAMLGRMVRFTAELYEQFEGTRSLTSLLTLVKAQQTLPGRKTVLYFSEGLVLPDRVKDHFEALVSQANRHNVAFYSVDARGLLVESTHRNVLAETTARNIRLSDSMYNRQEHVPVETRLNAVRSDTQSNLLELAAQTGGFLIANTNDFRKPLRRVVEDVYSYYEIAYRPANTDFDGRFRTLDVKLSRPNTKVQSRSGYFAIPPELADALFPYEVPLLKALSSEPAPQEIDFRSAWFRFGPQGAEVRCGFDVEVPLASLTFNRNEGSGQHHSRVTLATLFKDAGGKVVGKYTREVPFQVPPEKLDGVQAGSFIYTEHIALPPGRYTMETAVGDPEGGKVGIRRAEMTVPPPPESVGVSDLMLIRRVDPLREGADEWNPFTFSGGKVVPSLDREVQAEPGQQLSLYFVVYPDETLTEPVALTLEFFSEGRRVGSAQPELPAPDEKGRIPYIMSVQAASLRPGPYDVKVTARQGTLAGESSTSFEVAPPEQ